MNQIFLETIDSTNTYAKLHVSHFPKDAITCIVAETQTGGRGRLQRKWISPPGVNLYVTFYFRLPLKQLDLMTLGLVLASSMASILIAERLQPKIKWPNDLQLSGQKFGGVLCETSLDGNMFDVFAGIGINVNMNEQNLQEIGQPATSLKNETGRLWDRGKLLQKLQEQFAHDLELFKQFGFAPFYSLCERYLAYKNEEVRCFDGQKEWIGICRSLSKTGELQVELPDRSIHIANSGEISLRKM
jgi:BirA family biotin operon repressor/biotin-[acetyl-CoA-carboxylase] ligase